MSNDPPRIQPVGLHVSRTAKALDRAFERALGEAGGSLPTWLILLSVKSGRWATQREIAQSVGIQGATLTHHLSALERDGLVARTREGRIQRVELTEEGEAAFTRLRKAATTFDRRLRKGLSEEELGQLSRLLDRLSENA